MQKFIPREKGERHPLLSDRRNIIVIADEAHRSQYDFIDGFAKHMRDALPNASFIGFTGTPIRRLTTEHRAVFGDYISVYDIQRAVEDGATVPIYYEAAWRSSNSTKARSRSWIQISRKSQKGRRWSESEKLKTKWAALEAVVGTEKRMAVIAEDLVKHFEAAAAGAGRESDGRLHEPAHLR